MIIIIMVKSMTFANNKRAFSQFQIVVINLNFQCEDTNVVLFCGMLEQLFTAEMLMDKYDISRDQLPIAFEGKHCLDYL